MLIWGDGPAGVGQLAASGWADLAEYGEVMGKALSQMRRLSSWWRPQGTPDLGEIGERRKSPNRTGAYIRITLQAL